MSTRIVFCKISSASADCRSKSSAVMPGRFTGSPMGWFAPSMVAGAGRVSNDPSRKGPRR